MQTPSESPDQGTRALLVIGHGREDSLCHRLLRSARDALTAQGATVRIHDLLNDGFDPILRLPPGVANAGVEEAGSLTRRYQDDVRWMELLVVVHPVWWFAPPAILKGWIDRVLVDQVALTQPPDGPPGPLLQRCRALVIQTYNAPRVVDRLWMRSISEQFWKRAVCQSVGITRFQRLALYGADTVLEEEIVALERQIARALRQLDRRS